MSADPKSLSSIAAHGSYADQRGHEKAFDGICRSIQSASWASFSGSIQVDSLPRGSLFNGVGTLHSPKPIACQACGGLKKSISYADMVEACSVLCYRALRELGISTVALSKRLSISQPTASQSVKRGEKIVKEKEIKLMGLRP